MARIIRPASSGVAEGGLAEGAHAAMDIHHLVKMANEIGEFFESSYEHQAAVSSIAQHLKNFWDPRMRRELIGYARVGGGELRAAVREAVLTLEASPAPA